MRLIIIMVLVFGSMNANAWRWYSQVNNWELSTGRIGGSKPNRNFPTKRIKERMISFGEDAICDLGQNQEEYTLTNDVKLENNTKTFYREINCRVKGKVYTLKTSCFKGKPTVISNYKEKDGTFLELICNGMQD